MDILVLAKQVPGSQNVAVDPETGVLKRPAHGNKINPYDLFALETGLLIKERTGGTLAVLTMGPAQAGAILREAFAMGADEGYLLADRRLAGSDVLATSYALSQAIKTMKPFDLILCGKQTTDGDTAQVPPALSQWMRLPMAAWVSSIEPLEDNTLRATQDFGSVIYVVRLPLPCIVSIGSVALQPRLPSYKLYKQTIDREIHVITVDDFSDRDPSKYGLEGSPTKVERIFPPPRGGEREVWDCSVETAAQKLASMLKKLKIVPNHNTMTAGGSYACR